MAVVYRLWVSPYRDEDFEWNRKKSLDTFATAISSLRRLVLSSEGRLCITKTQTAALNGAALYGAWRALRSRGGDRLHAAQPEMPDHLMRPANAEEQQVYYEYTNG